jgi:hypothetical protein
MSLALLTSTIEGLTCGECGVVFGLEATMNKKAKETGMRFYCPKGCHISYCDTAVQRLEKELAAERARTEAARKSRDSALLEAEHFRKSRDGMKGAYRKVAVRVKNGVCPCCKRTFACLADHMKQKHPDFQTTPTP